ncbi:unnamed protein product [Nezara viridula]|uniref:Neuropeptide n=1 Tax=Nezara viridula TaxID=85310 RepID=A0A9P0HTA6_NEZVI|nr:unnamed protein product [Nezara viridula]
MKAFLFMFSLLILEGIDVQWRKIDELKQSLAGYNKSAEKLFLMTIHAMFDTKAKAAQFIDQLTNSYILTTSKLNETACYRSIFDLKRLQRSFQSELLRSQVPLENLLIELRGKLDGINNTINMCQDLAESKYSICKVMNKTEGCEGDTNAWLEEILSRVRCQFSQPCSDHHMTKRSAHFSCPVDQFACDSKKCISPKSVCDGNPDCSDGTDEARCCPQQHHYFYCRETDTCIETSKLCDSHNDCGESSDEQHCGKLLINNCTIENGMHKCDSDKCIGLDQVCDGKQDCIDGSDESDECGAGLCPEECTKKGGACFHGPKGPICFAQCPLGTFESPGGCTAHPQPSNRTVIQLMEEIPTMAYKQNEKFAYLKMKALSTLSRMISDVFKCLDPYYPILAKVLTISVPVQNQTVPNQTVRMAQDESEEKNESEGTDLENKPE